MESRRAGGIKLSDLCLRAGVWFADNARELPWREPSCSPWGVLVSEVMLQQTPVARVLPAWVAWMERWPAPRDLAAAPTSEVLRMWGRLGYPRRALRLQEAGRVIAEQHANVVPADIDELLALPGIGTYTARAVAAFGHGQRHPVIDVNVARVIARTIDGEAHGPKALGRRDLERLESALPSDERLAVRASAALMELGAVICTSRNPDCGRCPFQSGCRWWKAGRPGLEAGAGRTQTWEGTDRMVRGKVMAALREAVGPVPRKQIDLLWADQEQLSRCIASLVDDGLATQSNNGSLSLP